MTCHGINRPFCWTRAVTSIGHDIESTALWSCPVRKTIAWVEPSVVENSGNGLPMTYPVRMENTKNGCWAANRSLPTTTTPVHSAWTNCHSTIYIVIRSFVLFCPEMHRGSEDSSMSSKAAVCHWCCAGKHRAFLGTDLGSDQPCTAQHSPKRFRRIRVFLFPKRCLMVTWPSRLTMSPSFWSVPSTCDNHEISLSYERRLRSIW